jgi:23S rRNA (cytosine1962-C5)-methyltransferase
MASLYIRPRARIFHGHDWVYASEIDRASGSPQDGSVVTLKDLRARPLGSAIYNSRSQIVARRISRQRQGLDADFFRRRITQAMAHRERQGVDPRLQRTVWSESDGLPGVILDRYDNVLVLQTLTLAMDRERALIAEVAAELLGVGHVFERNDAPVRVAEGMEPRTGPLIGGVPGPFEVEYGGVRFQVDPAGGHKTGLYLDQRENHAIVAALAKGRRVLDCFSNQGAFALFCARAGAASVRAVESSADCCAAIRANAHLNGLTVEAIEANAFDFLKAEEQGGAEYGLIILDPPPFARNKASARDALRGYKELQLRALKMLSADGILASFSCSHHVDGDAFLETLVEASVDARRHLRLLRRLTQPSDHPILPHLPETEYLRGLLLEALPGR